MTMAVFEPGDIVLDCEPFVQHISISFRDKRCNYCIKASCKLKRCLKCQAKYYCSKQCQQNDWNFIHKYNECDLYQWLRVTEHNEILKRLHEKLGTSALDKFELLIKLVLRVTFDKEAWTKEYKLYNGMTRTLADCMSHYEQVKNLSGFVDFSEKIHFLMNEKFKLDIPKADIIKLHGILSVNPYGFGDELTGEQLGEALYVDGAYFDHSCTPTLEHWSYGRNVQFRALKRIDTNIEQPMSYYIDVGNTRTVRRKQLAQGWFFLCECDKCVKETDADFDYKLYRDIRDSLTIYNKNCELKSVLLKLNETILGPHSAYGTIILAHIFVNKLQVGPPTNEKAKKQWAENMRQMRTKLEAEFTITHGHDHPLYKVYLIDARKSLYKKIFEKYRIKL